MRFGLKGVKGLLLNYVIVSTLLLPVAFAQVNQTISLTQDQIDFFDHFFRTLGNPSQRPERLQLLERATVHKFGLSNSDALILDAVAKQYASEASQFNQSVLAIAGGRTVLEESDRVALENLNLQRIQVVITLTGQFLAQISPASAANVLKIVKAGGPR